MKDLIDVGVLVRSVSGVILLLFAFSSSVGAANSGVTYQGRLLKPDGTPVTASSVQFRMQIRTPGTQDCVMYEEIQTHDLSATNGMFAISLNDGTGVRQDGNPWGLFDAISNRKGFTFNPADCSGINTYTPAADDNRKFRVFFNDGTFPPGTWEALPIQTINYTPMSIESYAVGGFPASSLLRVEDSGNLVNTTPLNNAQYNEIVALVNGTSSLYQQAGELNGSALPALGAGQAIVSDGSGGWQAATPLTSETDPSVQPFAQASLPTCAVGEILTSDGTALSCVVDGGGSVVDATDTVKGIVVVPTGGGLEVSGGAIGLPDQALTPGSFTKVTVDQKGRVTSGASLVESDIPTLSTAGKVSGDAITSGTIGGTTSINSSGNIHLSGATSKVTSNYIDTRRLTLFDDQTPTPGEILLRAPATVSSNYTLTLPDSLGSANQVLGMNAAGTALENKSITAGAGVTINHTAGGIEITASGSGGTVTSVSGTSPISVTNGTTTPTISLDDSGVTANTYGSATEVPVFTVDSKGRITGVTDTSISGVSPVGSALLEGQAWIGDVSGEAQAKFINIGDIRSSVGPGNAPFFPLTCTASQTLTWKSPDDVFECTDISIASTQVTGLDTTYFKQDGNSFGGTAVFGTNDNQDLQFETNGTTKMTILANGNVGIGVTPVEKFEVADSEVNMFVRSTAADANAELSLVGRLGGSDREASIFADWAGGLVYRPYLGQGHRFNKGDNSKTWMIISSSGNVGIGTNSPSSLLDIAGTVQIADGGESCSGAGTGGMIRYNGGNLEFCNETSWQTLGVSGSGLTSLNGQTGSSQTFAVDTSGSNFEWASSSNTHTLSIPMASGSGVTAGLISKADYDSFSSKLDAIAGSSLPSGQVWVGDGSDEAGARFFGIEDLKSASGTPQVPLVCTEAQTMIWSGVTDTFSCENIEIASTQISGLGTAAGKNFGSSAGNLVELDGSGRVPASLLPDAAYDNTYFKQGGNTFGALARVGTTDFQDLEIITNNTAQISVTRFGGVGIGEGAPLSKLHVAGSGLFGDSTQFYSGADLAIQSATDPWISLDSDNDGQLSLGQKGTTAQIATDTQALEFKTGQVWNGHPADSGAVRMVIRDSGNVGIGTITPQAKLQVEGQITASQGIVPTGANVDFSTGNVQIVQAPGTSTLNLANMQPGGSYTVIVTDTANVRTYSFNGCDNSYFKPDIGPTESGRQTVFTILYTEVASASHCYIAWITGF